MQRFIGTEGEGEQAKIDGNPTDARKLLRSVLERKDNWAKKIIDGILLRDKYRGEKIVLELRDIIKKCGKQKTTEENKERLIFAMAIALKVLARLMEAVVTLDKEDDKKAYMPLILVRRTAFRAFFKTKAGKELIDILLQNQDHLRFALNEVCQIELSLDIKKDQKSSANESKTSTAICFQAIKPLIVGLLSGNNSANAGNDSGSGEDLMVRFNNIIASTGGIDGIDFDEIDRLVKQWLRGSDDGERDDKEKVMGEKSLCCAEYFLKREEIENIEFESDMMGKNFDDTEQIIIDKPKTEESLNEETSRLLDNTNEEKTVIFPVGYGTF